MADDVAVTDRTLQDQVVEEIRVLLVRRGLSDTALAELAGMKQAYLSRRMTGQIAFDLNDLQAIAGALAVDVVALFPAEVTEPTPVAPVDSRVVVARPARSRGRRLTGS